MNHVMYPEMLWLLLLPIVFRYILPVAKGLHGDALKVPFLRDLEQINIKAGGLWNMRAHDEAKIAMPLVLVYMIWALLVLAAARPQWVGEPMRLPGMSRDILLVVDISNSMREPDFTLANRRIDRLTAIKKTASEFIKKRADDRVGLVLFGSQAYLQAPITYDKKSVEEILWATDAGMAGNSTSIGDAIGVALKSLKDSKDIDKKIIILMTDGENNSGVLTLPQAINLAKEEGVKIYTIGVGADTALVQSILGFQMALPSGLDEESLNEIAKATQGTYFRAKDTSSLEKIYAEINKLEASENEAQFVRKTIELFYWPLGAALALALVLLWVVRRV